MSKIYQEQVDLQFELSMIYRNLISATEGIYNKTIANYVHETFY